LIAIGDKKERKKERKLTSVSLCSTKKLKKGTNKLLNPKKIRYHTKNRKHTLEPNFPEFVFFLFAEEKVRPPSSKQKNEENQ
jgi:hypothetical protein